MDLIGRHITKAKVYACKRFRGKDYRAVKSTAASKGKFVGASVSSTNVPKLAVRITNWAQLVEQQGNIPRFQVQRRTELADQTKPANSVRALTLDAKES